MILASSFQSILTDLSSDDCVVRIGVAKPKKKKNLFIILRHVWVCWRKRQQCVPRYLPGSDYVSNMSGKGSYSLNPLLTSIFQDFPIMIVAFFFASVLSCLANGERSSTAATDSPGNCGIGHTDYPTVTLHAFVVHLLQKVSPPQTAFYI